MCFFQKVEAAHAPAKEKTQACVPTLRHKAARKLIQEEHAGNKHA